MKKKEKFAFIAVGVVLDRLLFKPMTKLVVFSGGVLIGALGNEFLPKIIEAVQNAV